MSRSTKVIIGVVTACVMLSSQALADTTVSIDSITAAPNVGGIGVVVKPLVAGSTVEVGVDGADTGTEAGANIPGVNLKSASITPLNATTLRFTLNLNNGISQGDLWGVPEVFHYHWDILVSQGSTSTTSTLQALRTSQVHATGTTDPVFNVNTCVLNEDTGVSECTGTPVTGSFADNAITIDVPLSALSAKPGAILKQGEDAIVSTVGASGFAWFTNLGGDTMTGIADYTIPVPTVTVGVAPTGTADADVVQTNMAVGNSSFRTFTTTLPEQPSGAHRIVANACYEAVCSLSGIDYIVP